MPKKRKSNVEKIKSIQKKKQATKKPAYSTKYFFKRYKKFEKGKRHPKLITATIVENGAKKHVFMGLTESSLAGHHKNIEISNPEITNSKQKTNKRNSSFLRKEQRVDYVSNFEPLNNYFLHKKDEFKVDLYLHKKKK